MLVYLRFIKILTVILALALPLLALHLLVIDNFDLFR
jgi:hypothetical protein